MICSRSKTYENNYKSSSKWSQHRSLEGVWAAPGRLLAPDGFRDGSRDAPGGPGNTSWVAPTAPNGAMLGARCAPRGFRKRKKSARKLDRFRMAHGGRFFENLVVLGRQKGGFRVTKRSKISFQVKNVQKAPGSTIPIGIS